jgi:hypothetical protein
MCCLEYISPPLFSEKDACWRQKGNIRFQRKHQVMDITKHSFY